MGEILAPKSLDEIGSPNIPIIDFSAWISSPVASSPQRLAVARDLVAACHQTGFVYIKNHGISDQFLEEAFDWAHKFFDLPTEKKMEARHAEGSASFRGFSWPGLENTSALSEDPTFTNQAAVDYTESYDIGSDGNVADPNIWLPESTLPGFRKFLTEFYWECWKASQEVLRALALGLGLGNEEYFLPFHSGHQNELNIRYYPPVQESALANQKMKRMSAHTDFDTLTLLFQDDCGGLELEKPGHLGEFIHATPIPKTLVMNIGDALMRWSSDYLISTKHRVHLPPLADRYTGDERMTRSRYSIPYFVNPKFDTLMQCLPVCCDEENPPKYEPIFFGDYYRDRSGEVYGTHGN